MQDDIELTDENVARIILALSQVLREASLEDKKTYILGIINGMKKCNT